VEDAAEVNGHHEQEEVSEDVEEVAE